jgi:hypothetical protein
VLPSSNSTRSTKSRGTATERTLGTRCLIAMARWYPATAGSAPAAGWASVNPRIKVCT